MSEPSKLLYWDRDGQPINDTLSWAKLFEDWDYRIVEDFQVDDVRVVTVWTGIDSEDPFDTDEPNIFSTAVFQMNGTEIGEMLDEEHWPTLAKAQEGHAQVAKQYLSPKGSS